MRKEIIIAIGVGFVIGLIITFGIYTANKALKQKSQPTAELPQAETPLPSPVDETAVLEITEPENNIVVSKRLGVFLEGKSQILMSGMNCILARELCTGTNCFGSDSLTSIPPVFLSATLKTPDYRLDPDSELAQKYPKLGVHHE